MPDDPMKYEPKEYRLPPLRLFPDVECPVIRQWPSKYETERDTDG